jgi:hypothetical protein
MKDGRSFKKMRAILGGVFKFDANPKNVATIEMMNAMQGGSKTTAIAVADRADCLGVNFWP